MLPHLVPAAMHSRPERIPRGVLQGGFARRPLTWVESWSARLLRRCPGRAGALPLRAEALRRANALAFADLTPEMWEHFLARSESQPIAAIAQRALLIHRLDLR